MTFEQVKLIADSVKKRTGKVHLISKSQLKQDIYSVFN